jgi:hypothetical protein
MHGIGETHQHRVARKNAVAGEMKAVYRAGASLSTRRQPLIEQ